MAYIGDHLKSGRKTWPDMYVAGQNVSDYGIIFDNSNRISFFIAAAGMVTAPIESLRLQEYPTKSAVQGQL